MHMEHIFDDSSLSCIDIGILSWAQHRERFTLDDLKLRFPELAHNEGLLDTLSYLIATKGFLEVTGDYEYVFVGARKKEKVLTAIEARFDTFRQKYRKITGNAVPGLETALKLLKKHKDWREVVDQLLPALQRESEYKFHLKKTNQFCPPWPNFSTWMNQRRWEQEFDMPESSNSEWTDRELLNKYLEEIGQLNQRYVPGEEAMTQYEYSMWHSKIGPFLNIDRQMSPAVRWQKFMQAHEAARLIPQIVKSKGGLFQYLVGLCRNYHSQ